MPDFFTPSSEHVQEETLSTPTDRHQESTASASGRPQAENAPTERQQAGTALPSGRPQDFFTPSSEPVQEETLSTPTERQQAGTAPSSGHPQAENAPTERQQAGPAQPDRAPGANPPPGYGPQAGGYAWQPGACGPVYPYAPQPGACGPAYPYTQQPGAWGPAYPYAPQPGGYGPAYSYAPQPGAYGPAYSYGPPAGPTPGAGAKRRRRGFAAPLVALLLCAGLLLTGVLTVLAGVTARQSGLRYIRPTPGEVPAFSIEDLPDEADGGLSTVDIAAQVSPSVVCINTFYEDDPTAMASGSGVIFNAEGFIVTNAHVIENASGLEVVLNDGRKLDAWVVGSDERSDLAVVKVEAEGLVPAVFGDSDKLQVGERAVVIGNAAGLFAGTVTQGVISGLNREVKVQMSSGVVSMRLLQTSAAINPGNSGGAVVNRFGQVIGISSSKMTSERYEGLGFAIPSADAQPIVASLIDYGYVKDRAALGVTVFALEPAEDPTDGLPAHGLYIEEVMPYSDLVNHDITAGDVILRADGVDLFTTGDLVDLIAQHKPGDTLRLEIHKGGSGREITVEVLLVESR